MLELIRDKMIELIFNLFFFSTSVLELNNICTYIL